MNIGARVASTTAGGSVAAKPKRKPRALKPPPPKHLTMEEYQAIKAAPPVEKVPLTSAAAFAPPPVIALPMTEDEMRAAVELNAKKERLKAARLKALAPFHFKKGGFPLNPGGKPKGTRNRLQGAFMSALANDFDAWGKIAIERARAVDPMGYIRVVASLMPKQVEAAAPLEELSDDELAAGIEILKHRLSLGDAEGTGEEESTDEIVELCPVPETA